MFRQFSLRTKLIMIFLALAVVIGGVGYYQIISVKHLNTLFSDLIDNDYARIDDLTNLKLAGATLHRTAHDYREAVTTGSAASVKAIQPELDQEIKNIQDLTGSYVRLVQENNESIDQNQITNLVNASGQLVQRVQAITSAPRTVSAATDRSLESAFDDAHDTFDQAITTVLDVEKKGTAAEDQEINTTIASLTSVVVGLVIGATAMAIIIGILVASRTSKELAKLNAGASRIANGDFNQLIPVSSNDEFGQLARAFNGMAEGLRESYHRLAVETERDKILLESLGEGVVAVDENANIVLINATAIAILELPAHDELTGKALSSVIKLYDDQNTPIAKDAMPAEAALANVETKKATLGFHKAGGTKVLLDITANPISVNDKIAGAIMTLRDVTKEKEVDRMKTEFISLASHQLRTPLSAIKWFTEMLVSGDAGKLKPEQLDFAKNIADSTERMIALVNALLNISRIESGRIMVDPKPTDLGELVAGIVNDLKAKIEEKKQDLIVSVHQDLPKINLDARLIGQVYLNLLTNAIKYTPKSGEISVFISKKDNDVISQITDTGYGIPKDQQARIFQKFFRASNAVKIETDGTGLGLYLIKAIIESSGGKIWFESAEGKGTTFWFSIPLSGMKPKEGEVTLDV